jgi:DNA-directed RNA polymerase specialized sigma24 family protein
VSFQLLSKDDSGIVINVFCQIYNQRGISYLRIAYFSVLKLLDFLPLEKLNPGEHPMVSPDASSEKNSDRERMEKQLECLEQCLKELPISRRELLFAYYQQDQGTRIEQRKALAERLGITPNALKIRVFRIRETLARQFSERSGPTSGK